MMNNKGGVRLLKQSSTFSRYNNISSNIISNNTEYGIYLKDYSKYNDIIQNSITNNSEGIHFEYYSNENNVINNTVENNTLYGVYISFSGSNIFYHNNFNNSQNVYLTHAGLSNIWDDGPMDGGNFWSDHICDGNPSNGSQPYIISDNNIDNYPFQDPNGWN
jgi:parallel beta-helix repeat protein